MTFTNATEKRRAENALVEWEKANPQPISPLPDIPEKVKAALIKLERAYEQFEELANENDCYVMLRSHYDYERDRLRFNVGYFGSGPTVKASAAQQQELDKQRKDWHSNLVRQIWTGAIGWEEFYAALDQK